MQSTNRVQELEAEPAIDRSTNPSRSNILPFRGNIRPCSGSEPKNSIALSLRMLKRQQEVDRIARKMSDALSEMYLNGTLDTTGHTVKLHQCLQQRWLVIDGYALSPMGNQASVKKKKA